MSGQTLVRGISQIRPGTVPLSALVTNYSIPTANLADGLNFLKRDGTVAMTGAFNFGGFRATNAATPTTASDLATKGYVDALSNGMQLHFARLGTNVNVTTLSGEQTIDGVTTAVSKVFLFGQTTQSQNGLWVTGAAAWTRPNDWAAAAVLSEGQYIIIDDEGTNFKNTKFFCLNASTMTVDTTATTFQQDNSGTAYSATGVINLSGTTFSLNIGQGVENDGSNNLRVKLDSTSLTRSAAGLKLTPGSANQFLVSDGTNMLPVTMTGDATLASNGAITLANTVVRKTGIVNNETPSGTMDGTNNTFMLANTPVVGSVCLYYDGIRLAPGGDYTISGATITMTLVAPVQSGDNLVADYLK